MPEVDELFLQLKHNALSIFDYNDKFQKGELVKKKLFEDDLRFNQCNPDHPLTYQNTGERMFGADSLFNLIVIDKKQLSDAQTNELHVALYDCCAAVKAVVAQIPGNLGNPKSIPFLENLLNTEHDSNLVKGSAMEAIKVIRGELKVDEGQYIHSQIVYA